MIKIDVKLEILRKYEFDGENKKTIARELEVSKNTVKKYIHEFEQAKAKLNTKEGILDKAELTEIMIDKPVYKARSKKQTALTDEVKQRIQEFVAENERKKSIGIRKQCMNVQSMFDALIEDGYKIGYSSVGRYVNSLTQKVNEAFIKQTYNYGEVCEFDWGEVKLEIGSVLKSYRMAVFTSAKGNYRYALLYPKEQMQHFLDAHVKFFEHTLGVYHTIVYDNMKVAVAKFVGPTEKLATEDLKKLSLYYGFNYRFCNVRSGNEKGHVEKSVEYIRQKAFSRNIKFDTEELAFNHLSQVLVNLNNEQKSYMDNQSPSDVLSLERSYLKPLMPNYDISKATELRVDKYSTIVVDTNRYSVPDLYVGKLVFVKIYTDKIICYYNKKEIATHNRRYGSGQWTMTTLHYRNTLLKKPGAIAGSLAFSQLDEQLKSIFTDYYKDAPKDFIHLIDLISEKGFDEVFKAINELKQKNIAINTDHIKVLVNNTTDYYTVKMDNVNTEIEKNCRNSLKIYSDMITNNIHQKEEINA